MRHAFFVVVIAVLGVYLGTSRYCSKLYNCALALVYVCTLPPLVVQLVHIFNFLGRYSKQLCYTCTLCCHCHLLWFLVLSEGMLHIIQPANFLCGRATSRFSSLPYNIHNCHEKERR